MKRRDFLKTAGLTLAAAALGDRIVLGEPAPSQPPPAPVAWPDVVRIENGEPAALLRAALQKMGGMGRFISRGDVVVIKPNIGWDRPPELAANTNPELVAELVKECLQAGAKRVKIFDRTCNNPLRCYANSGIEAAAAAVGAEVSHIDEARFKEISLKSGEVLKTWPIYQDYLEADKIINVPIAKHHGLSRVTLGLKNLMGVMGGPRGQLHTNFQKKLIDVVSEILPTLTVIDAYRILTDNGPSGGYPADVKLTRTLVMSPCPVAADMAVLDLFEVQAESLPYLQEAIARKLNRVDLAALKVDKTALN